MNSLLIFDDLCIIWVLVGGRVWVEAWYLIIKTKSQMKHPYVRNALVTLKVEGTMLQLINYWQEHLHTFNAPASTGMMCMDVTASYSIPTELPQCPNQILLNIFLCSKMPSSSWVLFIFMSWNAILLIGFVSFLIYFNKFIFCWCDPESISVATPRILIRKLHAAI